MLTKKISFSWHFSFKLMLFLVPFFFIRLNVLLKWFCCCCCCCNRVYYLMISQWERIYPFILVQQILEFSKATELLSLEKDCNVQQMALTTLKWKKNVVQLWLIQMKLFANLNIHYKEYAHKHTKCGFVWNGWWVFIFTTLTILFDRK